MYNTTVIIIINHEVESNTNNNRWKLRFKVLLLYTVYVIIAICAIKQTMLKNSGNNNTEWQGLDP